MTPSTPSRPRRRPRVARLLALAVAAGLAAACSHSTSGTATTPHSPPASSTPHAAPGPHTTTPAPAPVKSDEDQARQTVYDVENAYNSRNWDAYTELMCTAMRARFSGVVMDSVKKGREVNGAVTLRSVTVTINGDDATAILDGVSEGLGPNRIPLSLKREDGWKLCVLN